MSIIRIETSKVVGTLREMGQEVAAAHWENVIAGTTEWEFGWEGDDVLVHVPLTAIPAVCESARSSRRSER